MPHREASRRVRKRPARTLRSARTAAATVVAPARSAPPTPGARPGLVRPAAEAVRSAPEALLPPAEVVRGGPSEHVAAQQLVRDVFSLTAHDRLVSALDDPFYEPRDRLVARQAGRLVAHAQLSQRVLHFGGTQLIASGLHWLCTASEVRGRGLAGSLLRLADRAMAEEQVQLGTLSTQIPHFFRPHGWAVCGRHSFARAGSRELLAQLSAGGVHPRQATITIRPWRQVELPALLNLHAAAARRGYGWPLRTEAYWRWLISRKQFDRLYVAIEGPDKFDFDAPRLPIVGYAILQQDRILELIAPEQPVAELLLARACGEAIERDVESVQLHAPPNDALFALFRAAGGHVHCHEAHQGEVYMVKVPDPLALLRTLAGELHRRAAGAGIERPAQLGLLVEGEKLCLSLTRRSVQLSRKKLGRSYLSCNRAELTRLLLGHLDLEEAIGHGRLEASTRLAREMAAALFPRLPWWRPPVDEVS